MKFGTVPEHQLSSLHFHLPQEPLFNQKTLPGRRTAHPKFFIGASTWGDKSWVGKLYPPKTPATRFRQLYPLLFNAVELNATHYNIYAPEVIRQWATAAAGKEFHYCPKFPQSISHYSNFQNTGELTAAFLESIAAFEEHLGPAFLQLSETFSPANRQGLYHYLASLPKQFSFFLEVRHPDWFADERIAEELYTTLHRMGIGLVVTDTPGRRDLVHLHLTVPKLFLRFVCPATHASSFRRMDEWTERICYWVDNGLQEAHLFLHPGSDEAVPELATYWIERLNNHCGLQLRPPSAQQTSLF